MKSSDPSSLGADQAFNQLTDTERAVFGELTSHEVYTLLDTYLQRSLEGAIAKVRFQSGRIDSVWGSSLTTEEPWS